MKDGGLGRYIAYFIPEVIEDHRGRMREDAVSKWDFYNHRGKSLPSL
jgi:hypothetical protein